MIQTLLTFAAFWAASYALHLAFYFGQGGLMIAINNRHPERRIQPRRRGEKRARVEIIASLKSLVVTSGCVAGGVFLAWNGWTLWGHVELTWFSAIGGFVLSVVVYDAWFYWGHRIMHLPRLYKHHFLHHKSVAPTVWSNYSDTLIDAFAMQSYYLVAPIFLPLAPLVLIAHRLLDHINGQIGHAGFEYFADSTTRFPSPMLCTTFHDQHHEYFNYNFANFFSIWDRLFGTIHPDYDKTVARFEQGSPTKQP